MAADIGESVDGARTYLVASSRPIVAEALRVASDPDDQRACTSQRKQNADE